MRFFRRSGNSSKDSLPSPLAEIQVDEVLKYTHCPLKHLYQYHYGLPYKVADPRQLRREAIREASLDLYHGVIAGEKVHLEDAFNLFDQHFLSLLEQHEHSLARNAELLALGRLRMRAMYNCMLVDGVGILDARVPFSVPMYLGRTDDFVLLTGEIDVVRTTQSRSNTPKKFNLLMLAARKRLLTKFEAHNSIAIAMLRYALSVSLAEESPWLDHDVSSKDPTVTFVHVDSGQEWLLQKADIDAAMRNWLHGIVKSIHEKVYYPRVTTECSSCPYRKACDAKHAGIDYRGTRKLDALQEIRRRLK